MEPRRRPNLRRGKAVALILGGALGCAGARDQDVLQSGSSSGATSSSGGANSDASTSGGGTADSGVQCMPEQEPNDSKELANLLVTNRCGTLSSANDVEFLTFTLQATTQTLALNYAGRVTLTVSVDGGKTVVLGGGGSQTVPFARGKPYFVQIQATDASRPAWRVDLIETP